jgi:arylformamidase
MNQKNTQTQFIDLSHTVFDGLITYKGLPAPLICDYISREQSKANYDEGTTFQIGKIDMVTNTGTYIDCPFHRFEQGMDLSEVELEQLADLEAITIDARRAMAVGPEFFAGKELENKAVLIFTDWARHWNTAAYFEGHPYLTEGAAEYLKNQKVKLVGIDSHNIDDTQKRIRPVHTILLGADILIVEHLCNLEQLPARNYRFNAVPPKFKGAGTFPVRAYAKINHNI